LISLNLKATDLIDVALYLLVKHGSKVELRF